MIRVRVINILIFFFRGKDNWGQAGQYQVIMKQITMDMVDHETCEAKLRTTRLVVRFF